MNILKTAQLGEIADVNWGDTNVTKSSYVASGFPAFSATGSDGFLPYADFDRDAIVLSAIGARCGKTWFTKGKWSCIKNTIRYWSTSKDVDNRYLYWATFGEDFWPKRGAAQPFITIGDARRLSIFLPPLPEQRRIAAILDQADALRAKRREALAQLDSLTQSIFIEMFGDTVENPKNLPVKRLIDIIDPARPITYGILMPGENIDDGVKYVRVVDMKKGGIELSGIRKTTPEISHTFRRSVLKPGDLLMSIRGHVGRLAMVPPELNEANITQDTVRLAVTGACSVYVREYFRSMGIQRWMARHTKGVAVRGINLGDLKSMPITLPSQSHQVEFSDRANTIEKLTTAERKSLAELDSLFASLQQRAFRGDL